MEYLHTKDANIVSQNWHPPFNYLLKRQLVPGRVPLGILGGGAAQILTLFQTKTCHFPHPFSDLVAAVRTPTKDLLKFSSNDIFRLFLFLSHSFGVEKPNTFIRSRGSLENHTRFQTIMVKILDLYPFSEQNGSKTIPFGAAHTYCSGFRTVQCAFLLTPF